MKQLPRALFALLASATIAIAVLAQDSGKRVITADDYLAFESLNDPRASPDGKTVAYVVTRIDRAQNRRNSTIWITAADGSGSPRQFTTSPQSCNSPRWSPDGQWLAFLSTRAGGEQAEPARAQIYLLSLAGGEARRVTNLKNGVSSFEWSPDGNRMVAVSRLGPSDSRPENKERSDVRHYKSMGRPSTTRRSISTSRRHVGRARSTATSSTSNRRSARTSASSPAGAGTTVRTKSWRLPTSIEIFAAGTVIKGTAWGRPNDKIGLAGSINALSADHRLFIAAGGL